MMENIGLGMMLELPCVVVDVQRGSPSTGLPTLPGQADVMQARWGSHGDYGAIAFSPWSPQEAFDLTVHAFNVADRYRLPVFVLADEVVGHMVERVVIPPEDDLERWERKRPATGPTEPFEPFAPDPQDLVPPIVHAGEGYRLHYTSLTHDERGYPDMSPEAHQRLVTRLVEKVRRHAPALARTEAFSMDDAQIAVVAFGSTARSAHRAVRQARSEGIAASLLRLVSLWPFPEEALRQVASHVEAFVVAEMNLGQIALEVERQVRVPVWRVNHAGGEMMPPEPILEMIRRVAHAH
jgi:2-oxoglutarate ferredoxin oxidoreductase subunit alpha